MAHQDKPRLRLVQPAVPSPLETRREIEHWLAERRRVLGGLVADERKSEAQVSLFDAGGRAA
jgi:hypothetical protein